MDTQRVISAFLSHVLSRTGAAYALARKYLATSVCVVLFVTPWAYATEPRFVEVGIVIGLLVGWYFAALGGAGMGITLGVLMGLYVAPLLAVLLPSVPSLETYLLRCFVLGIAFGVVVRLMDDLKPAFSIAWPKVIEERDGNIYIRSFAGFMLWLNLRLAIYFLLFAIPWYVAWALSPYSPFQTHPWDWSRELKILILTFGVTVPAWFGVSFGWAIYNVGAVTSIALARKLGLELSPAIKFFRSLMPWLAAMRDGLLSFAIGYVVTIFLFTGIYFALYRCCGNEVMFQEVPAENQLWAFFYFSVTTITTIGLSNIKPFSLPSQVVVAVELLLGVFWIVIYFAVAMSSLQALAGRKMEKPKQRNILSKRRRDLEMNRQRCIRGERFTRR